MFYYCMPLPRYTIFTGKISKSHLSKFPFFSHFFPCPPPPRPPSSPPPSRIRINIRHSDSSPTTKGTSFLEPGQFDFASKSKQAIGGMLKTWRHRYPVPAQEARLSMYSTREPHTRDNAHTGWRRGGKLCLSVFACEKKRSPSNAFHSRIGA